jgi:outer membrane protein OmpA-like peptidoglycan-associated protein
MTRTKIFAAALLMLAASTAYAANDDRDAVRDSSDGTVVTNTYGNCVRTKWLDKGDVCSREVPPPPAPVVVATPPKPAPHTVISQADRTVYFPFNKADLTKDSKAQLDTLAQTLKAAQDIESAKVVGTADRIGSVSYNDKLSQKRAEVVRDYLVSRGYTNANVTKTRWVGKSEPTTTCGKKMPHKELVECLQADRRVEIEIVYKAEAVAPVQK